MLLPFEGQHAHTSGPRPDAESHLHPAAEPAASSPSVVASSQASAAAAGCQAVASSKPHLFGPSIQHPAVAPTAAGGTAAGGRRRVRLVMDEHEADGDLDNCSADPDEQPSPLAVQDAQSMPSGRMRKWVRVAVAHRQCASMQQNAPACHLLAQACC